MYYSFRHKFILSFAAILLVAGLMNYYYYQSDIIALNLLSVRHFRIQSNESFLKGFLAGHFSDMAWCVSLCLFVLVFSEKHHWSFTVKLTSLMLPFITEGLQYFQIIGGTFDCYDIILYLLIIILFNYFFTHLILNDMKKINRHSSAIIISAAFITMAIASTPSRHYTSQKTKPQPCITHKGLTYSPVLVSIYVSGSYNMKDLSEAQRTVPGILLNQMNTLSPYKYQLADGVKPNLSLYVNYTSDSYGHFGADIKGYVFDGDFHTWTESNFITFEKLDAEVANKVNWFITSGWCKNCPSPCNP